MRTEQRQGPTLGRVKGAGCQLRIPEGVSQRDEGRERVGERERGAGLTRQVGTKGLTQLAVSVLWEASAILIWGGCVSKV